MHDPREGVTPEGLITTGADRQHVPPVFEPVVELASARIAAANPEACLYLYGSVATGQALPGQSDVDLLTVGLAPADAGKIERELCKRFEKLCRSVEISQAKPRDIAGDGDEAYGFRVFLRHYCVPLAGPDLYRPACDFPADVKAARGFNGDIALCANQWQRTFVADHDLHELATVVARKTLLAVAGLVSIHDSMWTTDRSTAAHRWSEIEPDMAEELAMLFEWTWKSSDIGPRKLDRVLRTTVPTIVEHFEELIGLWPTASGTDTGPC